MRRGCWGSRDPWPLRAISPETRFTVQPSNWRSFSVYMRGDNQQVRDNQAAANGLAGRQRGFSRAVKLETSRVHHDAQPSHAFLSLDRDRADRVHNRRVFTHLLPAVSLRPATNET